MKSVVALFALTLSVVATPAFAQDAPGIEIRRLGDIYPHLPPPGATRWTADKLVAAVEASSVRYSPKDVYELIDKEVPEPVIKAVAAKVGLFYDGSQLPLHVQAQQARQGAAAETIAVNEGNFADFFGWFEKVFADIEAAEDQVALPLRKPNETESQYERAVRAADEDRVRLVGPHEGRIQMATFELSLPATVQNKDGCDRPVAVGDASSVDFNLFRDTMGTRLTETLVQITSRSVDKMAFTVTPRSLYAMGRCGAKSSRLEMTLKRSADGAWTGNGDFK
jgi:hypothetical protein